MIKDSDGSNEGCHPTEKEAQTHMAALYANTADAEAASRISFVDDAEVAASFKADVETRIVQGLLVPWGKVARSGFASWTFAPGSLHWSDPKRVKLNLGHERKDTVGVAVRLQNGAAGLTGTFKIARGQEGDRALSLAEDGILDGFSVEVDFEDGDGWMPDPSNDEVRLVRMASLRAAALTGYPAFDDARVDRIAAARQEGTTMEQEQGAQMEGEEATKFETALERIAGRVTDAQVKLTEDLTQSVGESISAGVKAALEDIGAPQERGSVRAAKYAVTREEPIYRFDGSGHSMVRDAWYAETAGDDDAIERLRKYKRQSEEVATLAANRVLEFSPQTTSSASQIIPPGYRPDLYVPDLFRERPFVSACSRGVIQNASPFTVPVFGSITTGSADHVEGTNPSDGSIVFSTKTVTPQAVSGRIVLSRELVDSSNPTIDQIAFQEMQESYQRQTEAKVYTLLNGTSGAGGTITSGLVPSGAQAATFASTGGSPYAEVALVTGIRKQLALYPFRRFRAPTAVLMGSNATTLLVGANDSTGRPIFPAVGATNAPGQAQAGDALYVDGRTFVPAWANTGTAAGDSQIMIFTSTDVWVWESPLLQFRFEEKQGPANIELNIFGYFGTHLLRPVGLSGIRIT